MFKINKSPENSTVLPGRSEPMSLNFEHVVLHKDMRLIPDQCEIIWLGLGCFWGAERLFWQIDGVENTAVGYGGGATPNPTYDEVCSGITGHTELVQVMYHPSKISLAQLLKVFWEAHDPTQGMRQGNDVGSQYRSAIYANKAQLADVALSLNAYQAQLFTRGLAKITTEVMEAPAFYYAEQYHQQYLHKNPQGYCGLKGTGVVCPI